MKVLIIGYPRSGKTTLAAKTGLEYNDVSGKLVSRIGTDAMARELEWSAFSDEVCAMLKRDGDWVIEGCSAVRGLRKFLREGNKADFAIVWLDEPFVPLTENQKNFAKGLDTVWRECKELMRGQ